MLHILKYIIVLLYTLISSLSSLKIHNEKIYKHDLVTKTRRTSSDYIHDLVFCVKQDITILDNMLLERSTPGSSKYQQWLSSDEIANIMNINESYNSIIEYLNQYNEIEIKNVTLHHDYIIASAPISIWENMFNTYFYDWHDMRMDSNKVHVLAEEYFIPIEIEDHVNFVLNTVQLPPIINRNRGSKIPLEVMEARRATNKTIYKKAHLLGGTPPPPSPPPPPPSYTTISFLNSLYHITSNEGSSSLSQAVFQTNDEQWSPTDLSKFQGFMNVPAQSAIDVASRSTNDCKASDNTNGVPCDEANLDIQYIMGIARKTQSYVWWVDRTLLYGNTFLQFLIEISNSQSPPSVLSVSWGSDESGYPLSYITAFNTKAAALGLQGITILVSSGDDGVYGAGSNGCDCDKYDPSFPATSPYVTAVGATMGPNDWQTEVACQSDINGVISANAGVITSGGGFSSIKQSTPTWQTSTISTFLSSTVGQSAASGYGSGRGIPDVSFIGTEYIVSIHQKYFLLYGTSASCPLFAAMISIINANRLATGLSTIGFLNPTLYSNSDKFNDITSGNNKCCSGKCCGSSSSRKGFTATTGWDPVTGLGSIDFRLLNSMFTLTSAPTVSPTYKPTPISRAPTTSPTLLPTSNKDSPSMKPTSATDVIFDTSFTITSSADISSLVLSSDKNCNAYCISVKQAIAENMGVDYGEISIVSMSSKRRLTIRLAAINSVTITFRISASSSTANLYTQAISLFQQNFNSGSFSYSLNFNAYLNGATGLVYAQVSGLSIGPNNLAPTIAPTPGPTEFYQNYYFYIAVSVAGAAILLVAACMIYYYRSRKLLICYGLPNDFNIDDLRLILPGIKSVRKMRTKILITFQNNISANFNYRNCKNNSIYYFDHRIKLEWASLLCCEKCTGSMNGFGSSLPRREAYISRPDVPQSIAPYRTVMQERPQEPRNSSNITVLSNDVPIAIAVPTVPGGRYFSYDHQQSEAPPNSIQETSGSAIELYSSTPSAPSAPSTTHEV